MDVLPLSEVTTHIGYGSLHDEHPVLESHRTLCSGVLEKTRELREHHLILGALQFKPKVRDSYLAKGASILNSVAAL